MLACSSPWRFAADRVLLRLLVPRHPPYALSILTYLLNIHRSSSTYSSRLLLNYFGFLFEIVPTFLLYLPLYTVLKDLLVLSNHSRFRHSGAATMDTDILLSELPWMAVATTIGHVL